MNTRFLIIMILIVVIATAVIFLYSKKASNSVADESNFPEQAPSLNIVANEPAHQGKTQTTIADQWRWNKSEPSPISTNAQLAQPFTPQSVYDALQAVKVDGNGDIILDHGALISLDETLERIHNQLDDETLLELQELIEAALPGKVGKQTAQLVRDYHQFLGAQEEFNQIHEGSAATVQSIASLESDQMLYKELQALREVYLGSDTAKNLFRDSDANAQFMFESLKLELDNSLTPELKELRRIEIQALLKTQTGSE